MAAARCGTRLENYRFAVLQIYTRQKIKTLIKSNSYSFIQHAAWALLAVSGTAAAQPYPVKPVRIVVPYPPGGGVDIVARVVGRKLTDTLGQPVIVENRGGASGALGADIVAKAPPDGYTMGLMTSTVLMVPALQKVPYDAIKDFAPVILFATV